jgi:outer membrane protein OmpA-like peptidoglycan-associated protein
VKRRRTAAPAPAAVRRAPQERTGGASGFSGGVAQHLLTLQPALGNQAVGSLLSAGPSGPAGAGESLSLLGKGIPPPRVVRQGTAVALTVYFGKDFFLLDARNLAAVEALAGELALMPEAAITVDGHASAEGDAAHNQSLSENRRRLVIAVLGKDLDPRPTFGGSAHGEDAPAVAESGTDDELEQHRAQNRRVEIVVVGKPTAVSPDRPPEPPRLRLTPEELWRLFPPETPEEELERRLREPPPSLPERRKRSLSDLVDEKLDEVLDRALKGVGVKDKKKRDWIRPKLRGAIKSGASKALDQAIDSAELDPETSEALRKALEAAAKQDF